MQPGRARCLRPAPARARARHRVHDPVRPGPPGDRPGPGAGPGSAPARRVRRPTKQRRLKADAVTFQTDRPGVFGTGDVRIGAATVVQAIAEGRRAAYAVDAFLKGLDLTAIKTRQQLAEPQPEFLSIVPFTSEQKEPRYRLKAMERRGPQRELHRVRDPVQPRGGRRRIDALPPVHVRGDRLLRPPPARDRVRDHPPDARAAASPGGRLPERSRRTASPASNHDYIRDDSHAFILREPSRCIDCGRCARSAPRSSAPPATTSCGPASTRSSRRRST